MRPCALFALVTLLVAASPPGVFAAEPQQRPDVLFVAVDDLNDWIGCMQGHPQTSTPNLDQLAERSVLFTSAYCAAPACNPSRVALMTGRAPSSTGVYLNPHPWRPVLPEAVTLPQHFREHGYWAGGSGKIYHGRYPDPASWDTYWPGPKRNKPSDPRPENRPLNGIAGTAHFDWGPVEAPPSEMGDWKVADWVSERLSESADSPRFLACGIYRPHLPWYVPPEYFEPFPSDPETPPVREDDLDDVPPAGVRMARPGGDHRKVLEHDQWEPAIRGYLASIHFADAMLGRVFDALEKSGRADSTIVVLWSDHGWHLGEKQHWRKFALWERATRVPLMVIVPPGASSALPEGTQAGTRCDRPVSLLDLYPTLSELCGLPDRPECDGHSLLPLLKDPEAQPERAVVMTHGRKNHAVRQGPWRLIRYADGSEELYDHRADPHEWTNLADREDLAQVRETLRRHLPEKDAPSAPRDANR